MPSTPQPRFQFSHESSAPSDAEALIAVVPASVSSVDELLGALSRSVAFPSYFGFNWSALSDCLRDLSWVKPRKVILWHEALPRIDEAELRMYLDVLAEAVESWRPGEEHELGVVFPGSEEARVRRLLAQRPGATGA